MEEIKNENLAPEQVAENVEVTTEETPKTYTEAEFNAKLDEVLGKKIARREAKIRREYDRDYGELMDVLKAGTGKQSVAEITDTFKGFYKEKGVAIPEKPAYSDRDIAVLARAEAEEIINSGYDDVVEEVERLAAIGVKNMSPKEKHVFRALAEHRQNAERGNEFVKLGVTQDVYNSRDFQDFVGKFSLNIAAKDIYDIYQKTLPKKDIKPMGSMTNSNSTDNGVKDFYTRDEALKFTKKDFDKNPALYKAVEESMRKW